MRKIRRESVVSKFSFPNEIFGMSKRKHKVKICMNFNLAKKNNDVLITNLPYSSCYEQIYRIYTVLWIICPIKKLFSNDFCRNWHNLEIDTHKIITRADRREWWNDTFWFLIVFLIKKWYTSCSHIVFIFIVLFSVYILHIDEFYGCVWMNAMQNKITKWFSRIALILCEYMQ